MPWDAPGEEETMYRLHVTVNEKNLGEYIGASKRRQWYSSEVDEHAVFEGKYHPKKQDRAKQPQLQQQPKPPKSWPKLWSKPQLTTEPQQLAEKQAVYTFS